LRPNRQGAYENTLTNRPLWTGGQFYELRDWRSWDIQLETCQWRRHRFRLRFGLPSYRSAPSKPVNSWKIRRDTADEGVGYNLQTRSIMQTAVAVALVGLAISSALPTLAQQADTSPAPAATATAQRKDTVDPQVVEQGGALACEV
jgi:hypothetical protein